MGNEVDEWKNASASCKNKVLALSLDVQFLRIPLLAHLVDVGSGVAVIHDELGKSLFLLDGEAVSVLKHLLLYDISILLLMCFSQLYKGIVSTWAHGKGRDIRIGSLTETWTH